MMFQCNNYAQFLILKNIQLYRCVFSHGLYQICIIYIRKYDFFTLSMQKIHHLCMHIQKNFSFQNDHEDLWRIVFAFPIF